MATKGKKRRSPPRTGDVNAAILEALKDGELSTKMLAAELGIAHQSVYSRCRRLAAKDLLKSMLKRGHGPMYCVDEDKVVTRIEYDRCRAEEHDLRPIESVECFWSLP